MPIKAKRPCPKCGKLITNQCECQAGRVQTQRKEYDTRRGSAHSRGYTSRWNAYSRKYRREHPLCVDCLEAGVLTSVEHGGHVDHIIAVSGPDDPLFWDDANHASRCAPCHSRKTIAEDGGYGGKGGKSKPRAACGVDSIPPDSRSHWNK